MDKKKLAVIIHDFQDENFTGGGEKIMFHLIKQLCKLGHEVNVFCLITNVEKDKHGISNIYVLNPCNYYGQAQEIIKDENYFAVISENINHPIDITVAMGHSLLYREKVVRNLLAQLFNKLKNKTLETQWQMDLINKYKGIIALSNLAKNDYIKFLKADESKILVAYPGVEIVENPVKSTNSVFTFGLSAPGFDRKGGYIFLSALKYLKRQKINFKAKVIYPTYYEKPLLQLLVKFYGLKNNVEFIGFQENMNDFYHLIDCLVMPSKEESFGMVATEAMTNKRLVIASTRCGVSEIIEDGVNGFIFDIEGNSGKNLAKKMRFIIENKSELDKILDNAYETAKNHSWSSFCDSVLNLIKDRKNNKI
jgi:glycosyltransferase involved in cell wall biosynthesis